MHSTVHNSVYFVHGSLKQLDDMLVIEHAQKAADNVDAVRLVLTVDGLTLNIQTTEYIKSSYTYVMQLSNQHDSYTVDIGPVQTYSLHNLSSQIPSGKYSISIHAKSIFGKTSPESNSVESYVIPPCEPMTLRFKFSLDGYNPIAANVGQTGNWTHIVDNIWDWTNPNSIWNEAFKEAFLDPNNAVSIIDYGDLTNLIEFNKLFQGKIESYVGSSKYNLIARNNIVDCVKIVFPSATSGTYLFNATCMTSYPNFIFNKPFIGQGLFADTLAIDLGDIDLSNNYMPNRMFAEIPNLRSCGKIKGQISNMANLFMYTTAHLNYTFKRFDGFYPNSILTECCAATLFQGCAGIEYADLDLNNVAISDFRGVYNRCHSIKTITIKNLCSLDTGNRSLQSFCNQCYELTQLEGLNQSNTRGVTNYNSAFNECRKLETIPDVNVESATNVGQMFYNCYNMKYGILEIYQKLAARGSAITNHEQCFENCGRDTEEGRYALSQIPISWGGTMADPA